MKTRDVISFCYIICERFYDSKLKLIHVFIELYAKYYSMTFNVALLEGICIRLEKVSNEVNQAKSCRLMLELFLLLYYTKINKLPLYVPKKTLYEYKNLEILLQNYSNKDICKDICSKTIKNKFQYIVPFAIVNEKHRNDPVWIIWFELIKISKRIENKDILAWVKLQFGIFISEYGKSQVKNRIHMIFSIIDIISFSNNASQLNKFVLVNEIIIKRSFLEIMIKFDYILLEKNYIQVMKKREYIGMISLLQFPVTSLKIKPCYSYSPQDKKMLISSSNKICFDKIIKKIDD